MNNRLLMRAAIFVVVANASFVVHARAGEPATARFEFKEDLEPPIHWIRGDEYLEGKFDKAGNLVPTAMPKKMPNASFPNVHYANRPREKDRITHAEKETVYEFRSGFLVHGELKKSGVFIPTVGEKIIAMKDYHYSPEALRVYNLPGVFLRIENGKVTGKVDPAP
jgi:hypothetical protein